MSVSFDTTVSFLASLFDHIQNSENLKKTKSKNFQAQKISGPRKFQGQESDELRK